MARPLFASLLGCSLLATTGALADDKAACIAASAAGQTLRDDHKLVEAREQFRACAGVQCPLVVQKACTTWLGDVEKALPTVVVTAKDATGADLFDVRVTVDGAPLTTKLDGSAVPMNPGPHTFHFDFPGGASQEQPVLVAEGQKNQRVAVVLKAAPSSPQPPQAPSSPLPQALPPAPHGSPAAPPVADTTSHGLGGMRIAALALGGAGVAGIVVGSYFGLDALSKRNQSNADCPGGSTGYCSGTGVSLSKDAVSSANVSTVAFAAGLGALAGGAVLWLLAPRDAPSTMAVSVGAGVAAGGFAVSLGKRF